MNTCPIPRCGRSKQGWQLVCQRHWDEVPKPERDELWGLYRTAKGSDEHYAACSRIIRALCTKSQEPA